MCAYINVAAKANEKGWKGKIEHERQHYLSKFIWITAYFNHILVHYKLN